MRRGGIGARLRCGSGFEAKRFEVGGERLELVRMGEARVGREWRGRFGSRRRGRLRGSCAAIATRVHRLGGRGATGAAGCVVGAGLMMLRSGCGVADNGECGGSDRLHKEQDREQGPRESQCYECPKLTRHENNSVVVC